MVDVVFVGHKGVATIADAMGEDADDVETRHHKWRKGYDKGIIRPHNATHGDGEQFDAQKAEHDADGERSGVAHKDFFLLRGIAEDVVVEEWHDDAECHEGDEGIGELMEMIEDDAIIETSHGTEPRGKTVDAVDEVDGIGDEDDEHDGECPTKPDVEIVDATEAIKPVDPHACTDQKDAGDDLDDEFGTIANANEVVGYAYEVEQRHRTERHSEHVDVARIVGWELGKIEILVDAKKDGEGEKDDRREG